MGLGVIDLRNLSLRDSPGFLVTFSWLNLISSPGYRITKATMPTKKPKSIQQWSMYPSLHEHVVRLLEEDDLHLNFYESDESETCDETWDTNVTGRFVYRNPSCGVNAWTSGRIAVTIRLYTGGKYNVRVYHQRCKSCKRLSRPKLNETYAERTAYRIKNWHGIEQEARPHSGNSNGPHNSELCEGCRHGHCRAVQVDDLSNIL